MMRSSARRLGIGLAAIVGFAALPGLALAKPPRDFSYAYLSDGGSITMSGDSRDLARIRAFKQGSGPMLWFRDGSQEHLVRDADTLAQLDVAWRPGRELDAAEAALDRQIDDLDRKHDVLDTKRDALDSRRDALADRESELADREADDAPANRAAITKQRRELQQQQRALVDERRTLERPMKELRARMDALKPKLDALHQKQTATSAKEEADVRAILRRAVTAGTAKPIK